jgi:hypothetical protein
MERCPHGHCSGSARFLEPLAIRARGIGIRRYPRDGLRRRAVPARKVCFIAKSLTLGGVHSVWSTSLRPVSPAPGTPRAKLRSTVKGRRSPVRSRPVMQKTEVFLWTSGHPSWNGKRLPLNGHRAGTVGGPVLPGDRVRRAFIVDRGVHFPCRLDRRARNGTRSARQAPLLSLVSPVTAELQSNAWAGGFRGPSGPAARAASRSSWTVPCGLRCLNHASQGYGDLSRPARLDGRDRQICSRPDGTTAPDASTLGVIATGRRFLRQQSRPLALSSPQPTSCVSSARSRE